MKTPTSSGRLTYLDGLRGWMSLVVVLAHLFAFWLASPAQLEHQGAGWLVDVFRWTPLGVMMDGLQAVYVFFAISGLALTYPVLRSARPDRTLFSMAVFRYPRLTMPILVSCSIAFVLLAVGAFHNIEAAARHAGAAWQASLYTFPADFTDMLNFSLWDAYRLLPVEVSWNPPLWTMHVELFGSAMLFLLLAIVRWRWLRLLIVLGPGICWILTVNYGYYCGFFVGYCLAELLVAAERSDAVRRRLAAAWPLGWACLVAALALSMAWQVVAYGKARNDYAYPMNVIAALTLTGVVLVAPAQAWLSNRVSHFLGRMSFSLYLTHMLVICSFSSSLYLATIDALPYWAVVAVVGSLTLLLAFLAAYAFAVLIEDRLLKWLKPLVLGAAAPVFEMSQTAARRARGAAVRRGAMR